MNLAWSLGELKFMMNWLLNVWYVKLFILLSFHKNNPPSKNTPNLLRSDSLGRFLAKYVPNVVSFAFQMWQLLTQLSGKFMIILNNISLRWHFTTYVQATFTKKPFDLYLFWRVNLNQLFVMHYNLGIRILPL